MGKLSLDDYDGAELNAVPFMRFTIRDFTLELSGYAGTR